MWLENEIDTPIITILLICLQLSEAFARTYFFRP